jgi:sigma-B regulation protein RsbU (phosphoserine phosphatase)
MWTSILAGALIVTLVGLFVVRARLARRLRDVERAREELEIEETRFFEFLHGLGEAFADTIRSADLHRIIVESSCRILDSTGGALYLASKTHETMVPTFLSKNCPPVIEIPAEIREQAEKLTLAVDSYVRLHAVRRGEGVIGRAWEQIGAMLLSAEDFGGGRDGEPGSGINSAIVAPLVYKAKCLGVLIVVNADGKPKLTEKHLKVFSNIAEQSAFALYNEIVYREATEKKRLDHDIEIAREIQSILLPSDPPPIPGYQVSGINIPARQVSGDYFDYLVVDEHHTGVAIADVSGKGVPASLIMAMARSVIRSQAPDKIHPADVLHRVNRQLYPDIKEDMFISMIYLVLDSRTSDVTLARAGHDPPFLYRAATGDIERINPKGMALGIDSGEVFDRVCVDFQFTLETGDCLLLYTDGVSEALDQEGLEFGIARLVQGLQASAGGTADGVVSRITEDIKNFVGAVPQHDDITLIAIRKL